MLMFLIPGFDVVLLEKGPCIASNIREWEHVELFSPWSLNMSECGREILKERNFPLPQMDLFPTGDRSAALSRCLKVCCDHGVLYHLRHSPAFVGSQYISSYLEHLERYLQDSGKCQIHLNCEVLSIGRSSFLKREHINGSKVCV